MNAAAGKIQVGPVQGLQLCSAQAARQREGKVGALPIVTAAKEFLEIGVAIGDRLFPKAGQARNVTDRIINFQSVEEIVNNHPIGIEGCAGIKSLGFAPCEKPLYVFCCNLASIVLRGNELIKQPKHVLILLMRKRLPEGFDVFEEVRGCFRERNFGILFVVACRK